ncbi:SDR family NAD(P)-dependent oxidoreductase [Variovorax sp. Varisp41]|uniref:SDR family NAD(P)-dependent oxidoreductase n=1 Tax=Variovorax sp. Varisp41 TaxID=3243033 RepID=UPI0039B69562
MAGVLEGKVVLVTGAGRGVGREIALLAARQGASVLVNDLGGASDGEGEGTIDPASEVVNLIRAEGGKAVANGDSVSNADAAARMVQAAIDNFGRLDGVVNNAGILRDRMFHKMSTLDWQQVIDVHLQGTYHVSRAAAMLFREQQSGAYVHMTSAAGLVGNIGQANYSAAKLGIVGISRSIALEMARCHVRSNCVSPWAWSRLIGTLPAETEEQKRRLERFKQMTADKIAPMVVYLLSDLAAAVSGQIFGVRKNEIMLFSQPRPLRTVHRSEGWTVESIAEHAMPAMQSSLVPMESAREAFAWTPV